MASGTREKRSERNRTLQLSAEQLELRRSQLFRPDCKLDEETLRDRILCGDFFDIVDLLPDAFVDLMIIDPPYNMDKNFHGLNFNRKNDDDYLSYLDSWFPKLLRLLKPDASLYLCGDWLCSAADYQILTRYKLKVRNRIVWQREKGRGAAANWKNASEDIWFATVGSRYYFDADAVKLRRKVIAPYRVDGKPKDWENSDGGKFRMTFPSNFWDDITVPYWSMPENTDHPTQKPEKLAAKLILASSPPGGMVFDPFLGSGTTAVTAKKLGRHFAGIELNPDYCCWALERLARAEKHPEIQGYSGGMFWERNSGRDRQAAEKTKTCFEK